MDEIADPHQADKIASAYLKQLRQQRGVTGEKVQKPELQAWRALEERLKLEPPPDKLTEEKLPTSRQTSIKKTKRVASIWKRPISELWR